MRRDLLVVAAFTALTVLGLGGRAYYMDEPFFLQEASQGQAQAQAPKAVWAIDNNPPLLVSLLRPAMKIAGQSERPLRALFLPLDLLAALSLYLLAARFLKRPLWPTLIILAGPAYLIDMDRLMTEKPAFAFALLGLYCAVRGIDDDDERWYWGSAAALAAALMSKYIAAFALFTAAAYGLSRGKRPLRVAAHALLCLLPLLAWLAFKPGAFGGASAVMAQANRHLWATPVHRLRSLLAFVGGCWLLAFIRPAGPSRGWKVIAGCALVSAALFLPFLDVAHVRLLDRATGAAFATVALLGLISVFGPGRSPGRVLWAAWAAASLALAAAYWSVMARTVMFCIPPLVLAWAESLQHELPARRLLKLERVAFAVTAAVTLTAAAVDYEYAGSQKDIALSVASSYLGRGAALWCSETPGFRYYLLPRGAREMSGPQAWALVKPHDVVLLAGSATTPRPRRRFLARVQEVDVRSALPLRLLNEDAGEGGFYSNVSGFLPYSFSDEPVERFTIIEKL